MKNKFIEDEGKFLHELTEELGSGSMGIVFKTANKKIIIKISKSKETYESYAKKINNLFLLELPKDSSIIMPSLMLKEPVLGYTMHFLSEMIPIVELICLDTSAYEDNLVKAYIQTGGLRRRLLIAAKLARIFYRLHSRRIAYCDISSNNIFVSKDVEYSEVRVIDPDNLAYEKKVEQCIYTPNYGAPEVVCGKNNNCASDVYSFALLSFEMLSLNNAFNGSLLSAENMVCDWDDEAGEGVTEEDAQKGKIPWVCDDRDDSNRTAAGMPMQYILTHALMKLYQQTFGYDGRNNPLTRPDMLDFYNAFQSAFDYTVACRSCGASFYRNMKNPQTKKSVTACPYCNEHIQFTAYAKIIDISTETQEELTVASYVFFDYGISGIKQYLYSRHTGLSLMQDEDTPIVEIIIKSNKRLSIRNIGNKNMYVNDGNTQSTLGSYGAKELRFDSNYIEFDTLDYVRRRIIFYCK